jgi:hypothetical protein
MYKIAESQTSGPEKVYTSSVVAVIQRIVIRTKDSFESGVQKQRLKVTLFASVSDRSRGRKVRVSPITDSEKLKISEYSRSKMFHRSNAGGGGGDGC